MNTSKPYYVILLFQCIVQFASGQANKTLSPKQMETDLYMTYSRLLHFDKTHNFDSLSQKSDEFAEKFFQYVSKNTSTMSYDFSKLTSNKYCGICLTEDMALKIYSWDTGTGGTMRFFKSLFQYKIGEKINVFTPKAEAETGFFYSKIHIIKLGNQKVYLTVGNAIYSTRDIAQVIQAWQIQADKLVPIKIFKTKSNKVLTQIKVNCDFNSVADRPERPIDLIFFDKSKQLIKVSVVDNNGNVMTDRFILYKLNNTIFEFSGVEKNK